LKENIILRGLLAVAVALSSWSCAALADLVSLKNGDRLTGTIVRKETDELVLQTAYAGEIKIRWQDVEQIVADQAVDLYLDDGRRFKGTIAIGAEHQMTIQPAGGVPEATFDAAQVRWINPAPNISGEGIKWEGRFNLGAANTSGNTSTDKLHVDAEVVARTLKNRYTARLELNHGKSQGEVNESNSLGYLKYDRFLSPKWYAYLNGSAERDRFKDIELRSVLGAGSGYQFIETPRTSLSLEAGISNVHTDFVLASDESYPAARWALKYEQFVGGTKLQFFHRHEVLVGIADVDRTFFRSMTGLRMPVIEKVDATLQYNLDWDNNPAPGRVSTDRALLFTLGYQF
jgi:putative salt-induced outer membrane protein YdiY